MDPHTEWLSPTQTANLLQCSIGAVHNLIRSGRLPVMQTPLGRLIQADAARKLAAERAQARETAQQA